ncbi:MAG TPA: ABC transporter permease subunit [Gaiellales bacterium]|nr:ABC transporter permease subunit [Gaiellales bacterium]
MIRGDVAVVAGLCVRELGRRRVFWVVPVLTAGFLGLFTMACAYTFSVSAPGQLDRAALVGSTLMGLAMFSILFLGSVLAVFLTFTAVRGDAEVGMLQPLVVRPGGRAGFLAGRFLAAAGISAAYVVAVYAVALVVTDAIGGWLPPSPATPALALAGAVVVVAAISLLGSVHLSTIANGIAALMVFGAGLTAGLIGQIGQSIGSTRLEQIGTAASYALPFEALYEAGLHNLTAGTGGLTGLIVRLGPFGGAQNGGPGLVAWSVVYVLLVLAATALSFARRDL